MNLKPASEVWDACDAYYRSLLSEETVKWWLGRKTSYGLGLQVHVEEAIAGR